MKKIYLVSVLLMVVAIVSRAQVACPSNPFPPFASSQTIAGPGNLCVIFVSNMWPDTQVFLFDPLGDTIRSASGEVVLTDHSGFAAFVFTCGPVPSKVTTCVAAGCCTIDVPRAIITPMKLTSFTGRLQNDDAVLLDWTSVIELDSYQYEVERSVDGKHFTKIGSLNAAGASINAIKYTFKDRLPSTGAFFYRLKQIDLNSTFEYSKVVYVNSKKGAGAVTKVFPNPTKGEIQLIGATSADLTSNNVRVFSISGQRIQFQTVGANSITIDPSAPDGVYIVQVKEQRFKIVKSQAASTY